MFNPVGGPSDDLCVFDASNPPSFCTAASLALILALDVPIAGVLAFPPAPIVAPLAIEAADSSFTGIDFAPKSFVGGPVLPGAALYSLEGDFGFSAPNATASAPEVGHEVKLINFNQDPKAPLSLSFQNFARNDTGDQAFISATNPAGFNRPTNVRFGRTAAPMLSTTARCGTRAAAPAASPVSSIRGTLRWSRSRAPASSGRSARTDDARRGAASRRLPRSASHAPGSDSAHVFVGDRLLVAIPHPPRRVGAAQACPREACSIAIGPPRQSGSRSPRGKVGASRQRASSQPGLAVLLSKVREYLTCLDLPIAGNILRPPRFSSFDGGTR